MLWTKPEIRSFDEDQLLRELEVQAQYHADATSHTDTGAHTNTGA